MRTDCLYRHVNNRDVAFAVIKRFYIREKRAWSLKVAWWDVGTCHAPRPMGFTQRLTLTSEALAAWHPMPMNGRVPPPTHVSL